jgi:hypothetical protein
MRSAPFALLLLAAACAPVAEPTPTGAAAEPRQCFQASSMNGFRVVDRDTVDFQVGPRQVYRAELFGACIGLQEATSLGLQGRGGSGTVCGGADAVILIPQSPVGPQRCQARNLRQLTPEEVAASPIS